jgi:ribosome-associated protein
MTEKQQVSEIVRLLDDKIGIDIRVIDVHTVNPYVKYFVICEGKNERHIKALMSHLKKTDIEDLPLDHTEGKNDSNWLLVDYKDIVVHLFTSEGREKFSLEKLWGELPVFLGEEVLSWHTSS